MGSQNLCCLLMNRTLSLFLSWCSPPEINHNTILWHITLNTIDEVWITVKCTTHLYCSWATCNNSNYIYYINLLWKHGQLIAIAVTLLMSNQAGYTCAYKLISKWHESGLIKEEFLLGLAIRLLELKAIRFTERSVTGCWSRAELSTVTGLIKHSVILNPDSSK